ncbi:acyl-phosphate glycerol 3-phosphate acyltransferase [Pseudoxanthomonas yeongjuensis]|jgi:glycerol-3-phosphate acyltransferase PlsY|uniref:glycerol-3-phosphate 1-O-acyltransferase PlsY n=1 Tax=Pseudoxanthomonas yeongjuensis TaxID=377616 RepID=UPI00139125D1|nr:glycerol-3-phosphate 1-O-acyltransferase PlsY [Pseudoxanthomonas yeongjuensis]KAF1715999.1 acyl-phosphate glycerol 3-phosphate acyltransferase [Pseudoxanthomonas yeongjuensis]
MPAPLLCVALILVAYLLGSLSGSLLLGRLRGVDIRTQGSGNAGGTNALRTQGWKFALGVVLVDVGKGALAAWLGMRFGPTDDALPPNALAYATAFAAAIGHVWPLWHGFRGGKGVGTLLGGLLVLWPTAVPWLLLVWLLVLVASGYVGLASVIAVACVVPLAWFIGAEADHARRLFACTAALLVLFTHRGNLQRLHAGSESRFERVRLLRKRT